MNATRPIIPTPQPHTDPLSHFQPIALDRRPQSRRRFPWLLLVIVILFAAAFLNPVPTNLLVLGVDRAPDGSFVGRSDTIIVTQVRPLAGQVRMLSIPRDLWVPIADVGEQRINTAHFFAEANQAGSGPKAAARAVTENFGIPINYTLRIQFDGFKDIVDAMGGVDITLDAPIAGYDAGSYHFDGTQALAFVRNRTGADDFFRMENGQLLLKAALKQLIQPRSWLRIPGVVAAFFKNAQTNLPAWLYPQLALAVLRAGPDGIIYRTLTREMVTPWTTGAGAQVLLPNWDLINPLVSELFR